MFLRTVKSNGVEYLQLAHNEWVNGQSITKVIYGFGRKDRVDQEALKRLIGSISRQLDPEDAAALRADAGLEDRIMFGSDNGQIDVLINSVDQLSFLTAAQKEKIFHLNAERFFKK